MTTPSSSEQFQASMKRRRTMLTMTDIEMRISNLIHEIEELPAADPRLTWAQTHLANASDSYGDWLDQIERAPIEQPNEWRDKFHALQTSFAIQCKESYDRGVTQGEAIAGRHVEVLKHQLAERNNEVADAQEGHAKEYHRIAEALGCHVHDDFPKAIGVLKERLEDADSLAHLTSKRLAGELVGRDLHDCLMRWRAIHPNPGAEAAGVAVPTTISGLVDQIQKLQAFKAWVHKRMDDLGVPADPYPQETASHGCRIGGRFYWLQAKYSIVDVDLLRKELAAVEKMAQGLKKRIAEMEKT